MMDSIREGMKLISVVIVSKLSVLALALFVISFAIFYYETPMLCVVLLLVLLDVYLCSILYGAVYTEKYTYSKLEVEIGKSDASSKNKNESNNCFPVKIGVKASKAFSYPIGISIVILTVGIIVITVVCVLLKPTNFMYLI